MQVQGIEDAAEMLHSSMKGFGMFAFLRIWGHWGSVYFLYAFILKVQIKIA